MRLEISRNHERIESAASGKLPGLKWQRCVVRFERNVLSYVPASSTVYTAEDLKAISKLSRQKLAKALAKKFIKLYGGPFQKAVSVFETGMSEALPYLSYPRRQYLRIRSTNIVELLFKEVKRRT